MTLARLIADHRDLYQAEIGHIRIHAAQVPADTEPIPVDEVTVDVTDSGELGGPPFSYHMNRRLGPTGGYGRLWPWAASLGSLRRACRHDHPGHTVHPEFRGSLCYRIVYMAVVEEAPLPHISRTLILPPEDVERHLRRCLGWITEDMARRERMREWRDATYRAMDEPTPTRISLLACDATLNAVANFELEQRIWEGQRALNPELELPPWDTEWSRRQLALIEHRQTCDRCRRAA